MVLFKHKILKLMTLFVFIGVRDGTEIVAEREIIATK